MVSRREREKEERRKYILEKAQRLFAEKGFIGTSMAEIAEASEFAVGSLYSFFDSKEEILSTIFEYHIEKVISDLTLIRDDEVMTAREKIEVALEQLVKLYVDNQDFFRIYVTEALGVEWGVRTQVGEYVFTGSARYMKVLADIFKMGIEEGIIDPEADPDYLALIMRACVHSSVVHFLYGNCGRKIEELVSSVKGLIFHGITPRTGTNGTNSETNLFDRD